MEWLLLRHYRIHGHAPWNSPHGFSDLVFEKFQDYDKANNRDTDYRTGLGIRSGSTYLPMKPESIKCESMKKYPWLNPSITHSLHNNSVFQLISAMELTSQKEVHALRDAILPTVMCNAAKLGNIEKLREAVQQVLYW